MGNLRSKLTYANVASTLCLFLLLGGGAAYAGSQLAKNRVGTKQLKNGAVTGVKVKDGSLTGADIDAASLSQVPNAGHAGSADQATSAGRAGSADVAAHASDADTLQGNPPANFLPANGTATDSNKLGGLQPSDYGSVESARFQAPSLGGNDESETYFPITGLGGTGSTVLESETTLSPARATVARDLAVRTSTPITPTAFVEVQLIINNGIGFDALNCSMNPGGQTCTDTSSVVSIPAGSELTLLLYEKTFDATPLPAMNVLTGFRLASS
jgi:hypothetical protein